MCRKKVAALQHQNLIFWVKIRKLIVWAFFALLATLPIILLLSENNSVYFLDFSFLCGLMERSNNFFWIFQSKWEDFLSTLYVFSNFSENAQPRLVQKLYPTLLTHPPFYVCPVSGWFLVIGECLIFRKRKKTIESLEGRVHDDNSVSDQFGERDVFHFVPQKFNTSRNGETCAQELNGKFTRDCWILLCLFVFYHFSYIWALCI